MDLVSSSACGERQLFYNPLVYLGRGGQPMGALKIPQRLLGGGPVLSVRLHSIAKFDQGRLGGKDQPRIAVGFPGQ